MKIENIQVHQQGPLKKNFTMNAKGMNLVFGANQSGKTYIIEALVKWLFGGSLNKNSNLRQSTREWEPAPTGTVRVSGIPGNPVFTKDFGHGTSSNLTSLFSSQDGLPPNFPELLVVRAGDSILSSARDLVMNGFSGRGMLNEIEKSVPPVVRNATLGDNDVIGVNSGKIKDFRNLRAQLRELQSLRNEYAQDQGIRLEGVQSRLGEARTELAKLEEAKRYYAYRLASEISVFENEISNQPRDLEQLRKTVEELAITKHGVDDKRDQCESIRNELNHYTWVQNALPEFQSLIQATPTESGVKSTKSKVILSLVGVLSFFGVGEALLDFSPWVTSGVCLAAILGALLYLWKSNNKAIILPKENPRLIEIVREFKERFGKDLLNLTTFQEKSTQMVEKRGQLSIVEKDLESTEREIIRLQGNLDARMPELCPDRGKEDWLAWLNGQLKNNQSLEVNLAEKRGMLNSLDISRGNYLQTDPGIEWNPQRHTLLRSEFRDAQTSLANAEGEQTHLKNKIGTAIGQMSENWEELIGGLENKIEETSLSYKKSASKILAQICVCAAVRTLQEKEDQVIAQNLQAPEVIEDLRRIGGERFSGFSWKEGNLSVIGEDGQECSIDRLSTGANEQVMNALRILFSRRFLGETPGFLFLDDAFQHSDWERRQNLVDYMIHLVKDRGWQIFYFSMDNDLTNRFYDRAKDQLGNDFAYYPLS